MFALFWYKLVFLAPVIDNFTYAVISYADAFCNKPYNCDVRIYARFW